MCGLVGAGTSRRDLEQQHVGPDRLLVLGIPGFVLCSQGSWGLQPQRPTVHGHGL